MKYILLAFVIGACLLASGLGIPRSSVAAGGTVEGTVSVDGRTAPGASFWLYVVPAGRNSALSPDEAKQAILKTDERGRFSVGGLRAGQYLVAPIIHANALKNVAAFTKSLQVETVDFGTLTLPAIEVTVKDGQRVPVNVVRTAYASGPPGFTIPHSEDSDFYDPGSLPDGVVPSTSAGRHTSDPLYRRLALASGLSLIVLSVGALAADFILKIGDTVRRGSNRS
jgi:hypothetical protein